MLFIAVSFELGTAPAPNRLIIIIAFNKWFPLARQFKERVVLELVALTVEIILIFIVAQTLSVKPRNYLLLKSRGYLDVK